jgi:UDP:flavonoid glycosyltransferase YjiC (YdhE family)
VAQRVRASGAGTTLRPARLTPDRLRAAIYEARDRADGARRIRDAFKASGGPVAGVDAIERRLEP